MSVTHHRQNPLVCTKHTVLRVHSVASFLVTGLRCVWAIRFRPFRHLDYIKSKGAMTGEGLIGNNFEGLFPILIKKLACEN
jgi:hypothetical protein